MPPMRREISEEILSALLETYGLAEQKPLMREVLDLLFIERSEGGSTVTADGGNDPFQFGVTEFSLSFPPRSTPQVRCLAEVVGKHRVQGSNVEEGLRLGCRVLEFLAKRLEVPYDIDLFQSIFQTIYHSAAGAAHRRNFRFGLAIEWAPKRPPSVKCYYDLYAGGYD
ncbi:MAG: hypothetical protein ACRDG4_02040, partial [Chloroflexota bacterium]